MKIKNEKELFKILQQLSRRIYFIENNIIYYYPSSSENIIMKSTTQFIKQDNDKCKDCKLYTICLNVYKIYNIECDLIKR